MNKPNKVKKFVLAIITIISLVAFNSAELLVLAEEGEDGDVDTQEELLPEPYCGDGNLDEGEGCDDGNQEDGDGCSAGCLTEEAELEGEDDEDTEIITGDAEVDVDMENEVNTNVIETESNDYEGECEGECDEEDLEGDSNEELLEGESNEELEEGDEEECETECGCETECECEHPCFDEMDITNENEATVENDAQIEGDSGENEVSGNSGDSAIDTGDVNVVFGLVNTVNTNLINSNFYQFLLNIFDNLSGNISLAEVLNVPALQLVAGFDIDNTNVGEIDNEILIDASSGENTASNSNGDAYINTGDVNVAASVFNTLNTNIIGSNWTQLIINVFDNWVGDLVFPGKEQMQNLMNLSGSSCLGGCDSSVSNSNFGEVENEVFVEANTGENETNGNASIIRTGSANVGVNVTNIVNTDIFGGNYVFLAFNFLGDWNGQIFSLPPGLEMFGNSAGLRFYNVDSEELAGSGGNSALDIENDNTGFIKNSIIINATTGNNVANAANGEAVIETGDANVFANLTNVLNSNLVGTNWLLGLINIFGSWQGNIAFGRPNLWIGESAVTYSTPAQAGETITYTLTYINNGDADATGVFIADDFDEGYLSVTNTGGAVLLDNPGEVQWDVGTVPVGGSGSVSYSVRIDPEIPYGTTYLTNQVTIDSLEDDWNNEDNFDSLSIAVRRNLSVTAIPRLVIAKTNNTEGFVFAGDNVDYTITLDNNSDFPAYEVVVYDVLRNDSGEEINAYSWDLGYVYPREEIIIDYTVAIGSEVEAGFYTNTAQVKGIDTYGHLAQSDAVSNVIEIIAAEATIPEETEEPEEIEETPEETVEELEEPEVSLEDIENQLDLIENKIEKISEEIKRRILELAPEEVGGEEAGGTLAEEITDYLQEVFTPEVSAQEESEQPIETEELGFFDKFLAGLAALLDRIPAFFGLLALIALILLATRNGKKKKARK